MSVEGVIQYRLLGDHPAASGRYLTLGFPGESTSRDKIVEQVIQEHRINTSRYKLEVRKLVSARDAPGDKATSSSPPPSSAVFGISTNSGDESGTIGTSSRDTIVAVVLHSNEELHTYDRLTINVSQRQLADDDATRKEEEQMERQRRVREMEEELLATTNTVLPSHTTRVGEAYKSSFTPPPSSLSSALPRDASRLPGYRAGAAAAAVDAFRLQRAAALASQLFPIMKGQHSELTGIEDPANTHQCVLCRLPAFEERLTSCCHFSVCATCYASAAEMDMEEGRCPVCGAKNVCAQRASSSSGHEASAAGEGPALSRGDDGENSSVGGGLKRTREEDYGSRATASAVVAAGWKREGGDDSKDVLQRALGLGEKWGDSQRRDGLASTGSASTGKKDALTPSRDSSTTAAEMPREVLQIEERLRYDLEKALASLDGRDTLPAAAKAKRVVSAELAALCEE